MSAALLLHCQTSKHICRNIPSQRYLSSSLQYTKLSNSEATKLINKLNVKHKKNKEHINKTIEESFEIYERVDKNTLDNYVINAMLQLWWDYRNAAQIQHIWHDIESYHNQNNRRKAKLSYSSIMKCLLFPNDIDISKCIQTLKWMEHSRYKLSIHIVFLNKLISKCGEQKNMNHIKYIHGLIKRNIIETKQRALSNKTALIGAYAHCGNISDALNVFNSISDDNKDVVIIGAMMKALIDNNYNKEALELYDKYQSMHNHVTHVLAIKACINTNDQQKGNNLEWIASKENEDNDNLRIKTALIDMYGHFNDTTKALDLWESIDSKHRNAVCVGSIMKALIDNGLNEDALKIYDQHMILNNNVTHLLAIKACINTNNFDEGVKIHENISLNDKNDSFVISALIDFYGKFGKIDEAEKVFNSIDDKDKDIGIIDCMMTMYINNGGNKQALYLYDRYSSLHDNISHVLALKACINANDFDKGLQIHGKLRDIENQDIFIKTVLIDFYGTFGHIASSLEIFYSIPIDQKTIVAVNAMMEAYINCNLNHEAINLFNKLNTTYDYLNADIVTYRTIFKACNNAILIEFGEKLHSKLLESKDEYILMDTEIVTHLINMYGQCGMIEKYENVFRFFGGFNTDSKEYKNNMTIYKAMLNNYAIVGNIDKAMRFYDTMTQEIDENCYRTDAGIYIRLLKCCGTAGDLDIAKDLWYNRIDEDDVKYDEFVMGAFIDCMARKGLLEDTMEFMMENEYIYESGWLSLMSSCRKYKNIEMAEKVYNRINRLFGSDRNTMSAASTLMSHSYASQSEFDKQNEIRNNMQEKGWIPKHGKSEIYIDGVLHAFQSGAGVDDIYFNNDDAELYWMIDSKLHELCVELKEKYGFEHDYTMLTRQCDDDEIRNNELQRHSEKQAFVFGLLNISDESTIIIKNNLRICNDCHKFMKLISNMINRTIIISDPNRVHVFQQGLCKCGDFY